MSINTREKDLKQRSFLLSRSSCTRSN